MPRFDLEDASVVAVVGSGAGGGTLAHELTRRGLKVVLFEAGRRESAASFSQNPGEAFRQLTWLEPRSQSGNWGPVQTSPSMPAWHCRTVGGTTVHWTAATPRLQRHEIRARTTYGDIAGTSLADWPIDYEELKRWYVVAEKRLGVTRRHGMPGMPASNNFKVMYAGARKLGYKRVHTNYLAINSRVRDGRSACRVVFLGQQAGKICRGERRCRYAQAGRKQSQRNWKAVADEKCSRFSILRAQQDAPCATHRAE